MSDLEGFLAFFGFLGVLNPRLKQSLQFLKYFLSEFGQNPLPGHSLTVPDQEVQNDEDFFIDLLLLVFIFALSALAHQDREQVFEGPILHDLLAYSAQKLLGELVVIGFGNDLEGRHCKLSFIADVGDKQIASRIWWTWGLLSRILTNRTFRQFLRNYRSSILVGSLVS